MWIEPVVLEGRHIRLEPLAEAHAAALWSVSDDFELYRFKPYILHSLDDMRLFIAKNRSTHTQGGGLTFATLERSSDRPVGSSGYHNADAQHRRLEIGGTWVAPPWQRTAINTEAKRLMLAHAFERWEVLRVTLKTDARNVRSRNAIERLGARLDGVLRAPSAAADGGVRDAAFFSMLAREWPDARARLDARLARGVGPAT